MAHKKGQGSSSNGRDSKPKYLGVKKFAGEVVKPGGIILRQRGTRIYPGANCGMGRDFTIYSLIDGHVEFAQAGRTKKVVNVVAEAEKVAAE